MDRPHHRLDHSCSGDFNKVVAFLKADTFLKAVFELVDLVLGDRSVGDLLRFAWSCPPMLAELLKGLDERRSTVPCNHENDVQVDVVNSSLQVQK